MLKTVATKVTRFSLSRPKWIVAVMLITTLVPAVLAGLPSLWPETFPGLSGVTVDVDPENMLAFDEPARIAHRQSKAEFGLHDAIVLGVVNEVHPQGVFNAETLGRVHALTAFAHDLEGVEPVDLLSLSTVDSIDNAGPGTVRFQWLMEHPPADDAEALEIRDRAMRIPLLRDTLVSADGKSVAIYIPLTHKDVAHEVSEALTARIDKLGRGSDDFHIAGLPVAEDTFGVEMFKQMAISAPVAMLVIFALLFFFFRKVIVIAAPLVIALVSVISTMALLVVSGNSLHIMSSMIPIFIMPIAVLDAIHIISDFFDRYQRSRDRRETMREVMGHLFTPMLFTSLTTAAGFASLAFTPIPPVQTFGIFVAVGVMLAWFWTITFIPAFIMLIPEARLTNFGRRAPVEDEVTIEGALGQRFARFAHAHARPIVVVTVIIAAVAAYGMSLIKVNDNPTRWFEPDHPIRVADRVLNSHFGGTYDAYLQLEYAAPDYTPAAYAERVSATAAALRAATQATFATATGLVRDQAVPAEATALDLLDQLDEQARARLRASEQADVRAAWASFSSLLGEQMSAVEAAAEGAGAPSPEATKQALLAAADSRASELTAALSTLSAEASALATATTQPADAEAFQVALEAALDTRDPDHAPAFDGARHLVAGLSQQDQAFKDPALLRYMETLQAALLKTGIVGKSNTVADIVKTVHRDLLSGEERDFRVPASREVVAQTLEQYTSSHRKDDLWHFVTPDYQKAVVWMQLTSGDNADMQKVLDAVDVFYAANPPPLALKPPAWFGLTYINVVWQDRMVGGMLEAFIGSFIIVLLMMVLLFRSVLWGLLSMLPLTITVGLMYGLIGLLGKDYDMPVAVLSSLSLGLAVDYAIHFLARSRELYAHLGSWRLARHAVFGEPARAIARNVVVVGLGFTPLLLAPLLPYQTVGLLIASILLLAGATTLVLLPALISLLEPWLFPAPKPRTAPLELNPEVS